MAFKVVLLVSILLLQACSIIDEKKFELSDSSPISSANVEQGIVNDVGRLNVGDSLISNITDDTTAREYLVLEVYTAASGRTCREVDIKELDGEGTIETAVLCQKKSGEWYWPRSVIFQ